MISIQYLVVAFFAVIFVVSAAPQPQPDPHRYGVSVGVIADPIVSVPVPRLVESVVIQPVVQPVVQPIVSVVAEPVIPFVPAYGRYG